MSQRKRSNSNDRESSNSQSLTAKKCKQTKTVTSADLCIQFSDSATDINSVRCTVCELRHHTTCFGWDFVLQANDFRVIRELGWVCPVYQEGARHSIDKLKSDYANLACLVLELQNKMRTFKKSAAEATKTAFVENTVQAPGNWTSSLDQKCFIKVLYFDYAKAFDSVSIPKLMYKLSMHGIEEKLCINS